MLQINRTQLLALLAGLSFVLVVATYYATRPNVTERLVRYQLEVKNSSNRLQRDVALETFMPVSIAGLQQVEATQVSQPYTIRPTQAGDRIAVSLKKLAPYGIEVVNIEAKLALNQSPSSASEDDLQSYLVDHPKLTIKDPKIDALAKQLKRETTTATVQAIMDWIAQGIRKQPFQHQEHGALHALTTQKADCTEAMYLFIALSRANGIPSKGVAGYRLMQDQLLRSRDYHNWALYYDNQRWHLADANQQILDERYDEYVATQLLNVSDPDEQIDARYVTAANGISVRMN